MTTPSPFSAPPGQEGRVRMLITAIVLMTLAMVFMLGMIVGRLVSPSGPPIPERLDAGEIPRIEVALPAGARIVRESVGEGRILVAYESLNGARGVIAAPAPAGPAHFVYVTQTDTDAAE